MFASTTCVKIQLQILDLFSSQPLPASKYMQILDLFSSQPLPASNYSEILNLTCLHPLPASKYNRNMSILLTCLIALPASKYSRNMSILNSLRSIEYRYTLLHSITIKHLHQPSDMLWNVMSEYHVRSYNSMEILHRIIR